MAGGLSTAAEAGATEAGAEGWRRNVYALCLSQFTSIFGFSLAIPFMPLFLSRELHINDLHQLALWTGLVAAGAGVGMSVASPFWGWIADRTGRKPMLIRAIVGGSVVLAATALVQNTGQLLAARVGMGGVAGSIASTNALAAAEAPREKVGWSLGLLGTAVAVGRATGPLVGGLLAAVLDLRVVFLVGSIVCLAPAPIVMALVKERQRPERKAVEVSLRAALRGTSPGTPRVLAALILAQGLTQFSFLGAQNFSVLRVLELEPGRAALATGVAFTSLGLATAAGALGSGWLGARIGYKTAAVLAGGVLTVAGITLAKSGTLPVLVASLTAFGLAFGTAGPLVASMLGLEAPSAIKATIFGFGASATALGSTIGPLTVGAVAAATSVSNGLLVCAAAGLLLTAIVALFVREPVAPS